MFIRITNGNHVLEEGGGGIPPPLLQHMVGVWLGSAALGHLWVDRKLSTGSHRRSSTMLLKFIWLLQTPYACA